jgi:hypothetical protein
MRLLVTAVGVALSLGLGRTPTFAAEPVRIPRQSLSAILQAFGYRGDYHEVRRNSSGARLYIYESESAGLGIFIIEGGRVIRKIERPGLVAYLDDNERFVAWTNDLKRGVDLAGGKHLDVVPITGAFGVDWSGKFFFNADSPKSITTVGTIANPTQILVTSRMRVPYHIFAGDDALYLCGPAGSEPMSVCEVYHVSSSKATLVQTREIPDSRDVLDVDPKTGRMLVLEASDFFPKVRIVHADGSKDIPFGIDTTVDLFLQTGVMNLSD